MRAIDTNVLVRLITRDDARQTRAAERYVARGAWVSHVVLVESVWVLGSVYDLTPARLATVIEMLLDHRHLALQGPDVVTAALARFRERPSTSFSDCLVLETSRKAGHLPLGTFDRALARLDNIQRL